MKQRPLTSSTPDNHVLFINFADSKVPTFKEVPGKDWVQFGEDNSYPDYLLYLYNKSSKHNAIVNGKLNYIFGKGLVTSEDDTKGQELLVKCNRFGETLNEVVKKITLDIEVFGGAYLQEIRDRQGRVVEFYHLPFQKCRVDSDGTTVFFKEDWKKNTDPVPYPIAKPGETATTSVAVFKEYRPGTETYPLPGYLASCNYIETDIEISKYHLSAIRNGMFPSKMIIFNTGEPSEDGKRKLEKAFKQKFAGAENSGRFMMVFNNDPTKAPIIQDLSATELDKQFTILNETVTQEIFSGHGVTTPSLFGIATAGKLGEANQLQEGYDIFRNTYAEVKQNAIEEFINYEVRKAGALGTYKLQPLEPIGFKLSEAGLLQVAPKAWILEKLGIDVSKYPEAQVPGATPEGAAPAQMVNDNVKNLTGRQYQQLNRILRDFAKQRITREVAASLLRSGLGLSDEEISTMLGDGDYTEEEVADMFMACGDDRGQYLTIDGWEATGKEEFSETLGAKDSEIIAAVKKDPLISTETLARALKISRTDAAKRLAELTGKGVIEQETDADGTIRRTVVDVPDIEAQKVDVFIRYTYEKKPGVPGKPIIDTTRPFCRRLVELSEEKMYSRADIERISSRVGYDVFNRTGGFWTQKDGTVSASCRHYWKTNVVVKRRGKK